MIWIMPINEYNDNNNPILLNLPVDSNSRMNSNDIENDIWAICYWFVFFFFFFYFSLLIDMIYIDVYRYRWTLDGLQFHAMR